MFDAAKQVFAAVLLACLAAELETEGVGMGAAKKAKAAQKLSEALVGVLPVWLDPIAAALSPWLIDAVVAMLNRTGFFAQFAAVSKG